jgi:aquaporin Z
MSTLGENSPFLRDTPLNPIAGLRSHTPEYLMEAGQIAFYMFLICTFATLLLHPTSPIHQVIHSSLLRRAVMGLLVGSSVTAIIISPWGSQSGGHFNPAMTLSFYRLGKLAFWDAFFYAVAQFAGAVVGVTMAAVVLRDSLKSSSVRYAVTTPGRFGNSAAFAGEVIISFVLMTVVLFANDRETITRYTPYLVGALYALFITFEAPLSGMSMNPARSFGSAFRAGFWQEFWIYLIAPTVGMLAGAEMFLWVREGIGPYCAKLYHHNNKRCIFHHRW